MIKESRTPLPQAPFRVKRRVGNGAIVIGWRFLAVGALALLTSIILGLFDQARPTSPQLAEIHSRPTGPFNSASLKRTTVEEPHSAALPPETSMLEPATRAEQAQSIVPVEVGSNPQPLVAVQTRTEGEPTTNAPPNVTKVARASSVLPVRSVRQRGTVATAQPPVRSAEAFRPVEAPGPERGGN